jgi:hypothetical protein
MKSNESLDDCWSKQYLYNSAFGQSSMQVHTKAWTHKLCQICLEFIHPNFCTNGRLTCRLYI